MPRTAIKRLHFRDSPRQWHSRDDINGSKNNDQPTFSNQEPLSDVEIVAVLPPAYVRSKQGGAYSMFTNAKGECVVIFQQGMEGDIGVAPDDTDAIRSALRSHSDAPSLDAVRAGRKAAADAARGVNQIAAINKRNRDFWDAKK